MRTIRDVIGKREAHDQILHLRQRNAQLKDEVERLHSAIGRQKEIAEAIRAAVVAAEPFKRVPYRRTSKPGSPVTAVLKLSDWHIGEVVRTEETEGFGAFNWVIAQERINYITDKFIEWVETQRHGYRIDKLAVFGEGDYIAGNIHLELLITNEFPAPVQVANAGTLLGEQLAKLAARFGHITFFGVGADNHGRMFPKPQFKQKAQSNFSFLVHAIARTYLRHHDNIEFTEAEGMKYLAVVNSKRFLIEHGDAVKSWLGIPYYGLEREQGREARRRMNTEKGFDFQCVLPGQSYWKDDGTVVAAENLDMHHTISGIDGLEVSPGVILNRTDYAGEVVSMRVRGLPDPLRLTSEHPILSLRARYPCGYHARPGRRFLETGQRQPLLAAWKPASSLQKGDWVYYPVPQKIEDIDALSMDHLRLIGLYVAEGWTSPSGQYTKFGLNPDLEQPLFDWILDAVKRLFGCRGSDLLLADGRRYAIRFSRQNVGKFFQNWAGRLAWNKKLHSSLLRLPLEKQRVLFSSWMEGDGTKTRNGYFRGFSTSEVLARQMYIIGCRLGVRPILWRKDRYIDKNGSAHRAHWEVGYSERRWTKNLHRICPPRFVPHRVMETICFEYCGPTYNCSVPVGESYVVGGVLVHNSIGHWHVPAIVARNIIVNGSLSGTNEYDHGAGRHSPPAQVAFLVHPQYWLFNYVPFGVQGLH